MNFFKKLVRGYKRITGKTDVELAFDLFTAGLSSRERDHLRSKLEAVQVVTEIAAMTGNTDPRIQEAGEWADGAIKILDGT